VFDFSPRFRRRHICDLLINPQETSCGHCAQQLEPLPLAELRNLKQRP
jgi:hypothetical protein